MNDQTPNVTGAFTKLLAFANQRPGLEFGNYGTVSTYRSEMRRITKQHHEVKALAAQAIALSVTDADIVEAAPRAFSGRLEWNGTDWDYCTGQYWPTEYRAAAAAVIDQAIHTKKQANAAAHPGQPQFCTVADVREHHERTGSYWFKPSSMRFFGTRIHTKGLLIAGKYFITSEQPPHGPRGFTIREVTDSGDIRTVGELCGYKSAKSAASAARNLEQVRA